MKIKANLINMFDLRALKREQNMQSKKLLLRLLWAENQVFGHLYAASNRRESAPNCFYCCVRGLTPCWIMEPGKNLDWWKGYTTSMILIINTSDSGDFVKQNF